MAQGRCLPNGAGRSGIGRLLRMYQYGAQCQRLGIPVDVNGHSVGM
jgi:hypothetical protein